VGGGAIYILPYLSSYFYIPMKEAMHLTNMQIGLMASAMGFTSTVFYWPRGWMADRFSPRKLIAFSMVVNGHCCEEHPASSVAATYGNCRRGRLSSA
jgi:MFS family permease